MKNSKRIWLYAILGLVLVGGLVTAVFYKSGKNDPAKEEYGELLVELKDSQDSLLIVRHYEFDTIVITHFKDGHTNRSAKTVYDTVKIENGSFCFRYRFSKTPTRVVLGIATKGQTRKHVSFQNPYYDRPISNDLLLLENGRKMTVKITGKDLEHSIYEGSALMDTMHKKDWKSDDLERFHKLTNGQVTDPNVIKLFSANQFIFDHIIYNKRSEYSPDTLQLILDNFDPFIRNSYLGRKLKAYIRKEKNK